MDIIKNLAASGKWLAASSQNCSPLFARIIKIQRGQSNIIGFLLTVAIAVVIASATLFWAQPLLERTQDQQEVMRLETKFLELHEVIKKVASEQGSLSMQFDLNRGTLTLDNVNNTIIYSGQYDIANPTPRKAVFGNVSIAEVQAFNITRPGLLGTDEPAVLLEQGAMDFFLHYRPLNNSAGNCYRIKLLAGSKPGTGEGRNTIILTWKGENTTTFPTGCSAGLLDQLVEFDIA